MVTNSVYSRDVRVKRYAEYLADDGHQVDVVCLASEDRKPQDGHPGVTAYPIAATRSRREKLGLVLNWMKLWSMMFARVTRLDLRKPYDCIHVHNMPDFLVFCALLPRLRGRPVLLNIHDPTPEIARSKLGLSQVHPIIRAQEFLERLSVAFSTHVITATPSFRKTLIGRGIAPDKITVITNAADTRYFDGSTLHHVRRDTGGPFTLLYVGTVAKRYGLHICIQALPRLTAAIPGVKLRIIRKIRDEGQALEECLDLAHQLGVADRVQVEGPTGLEAMPSIMAHADLGVYPALRDIHMDAALSLKIPEMATVRLPIVATRLSVLEDLFGDDAIAFVPPDDPKALADTILELYRAPDLREHLARNASLRSAELSWELQYDEYRQLLEEQLGKPVVNSPALEAEAGRSF